MEPTGPNTHNQTQPFGISRRDFMQWIGTGSLIAGLLPACKRIDTYLVPHQQGPEWNVPGLASRYATCMPGPRQAVPLIAVCRDSRPVQLEPSTTWPQAAGLPVEVQASLYSLYDPNRSRQILFHGQPALSEESLGAFASWARKSIEGGRCAFVIDENAGPVERELLTELAKRNPAIRLYHWDPLSDAPTRGQALEEAVGPGIVAVPRWERVRRLLTIDCDWLASEPMSDGIALIQGRLPAEERTRDLPGTERSRIYTIEGRLSISGNMADHRLSVQPSAIPLVIWELARRLGQATQYEPLLKLDAPPRRLPESWSPWLEACCRDLAEHRAQSLILLGGQYAAPLHRLVLDMNAALSAPGVTLSFLQAEPPLGEPLSQLPQAVRRKEVDTLFLLTSTDPVLESATAIDWHELLQTPGLESIHHGLYVNHSAKACHWHFPATHYLETWGIERDAMGHFCYQQPVTLPLYGGFSVIEMLAGLMNSKGVLLSAHQMPDHVSPALYKVKRCFERAVSSTHRETAWTEALGRGFSPETAYSPVLKTPKASTKAIIQACRQLAESVPPPDTIEVQIVPDYALWDGRFRSNAWLRELPDPITGLCWEGAIQLGIHTINNLKPGARATLGGSVPGVICQVPGMPDNFAVIPMGHSDTIWALIDHRKPQPWVLQLPIAQLREYRDTDPQAAVAQLPPQLDPKLNEVFNRQLKNQPNAVPPDVDLKTSPLSDRIHQWGMVIDLSLCIGCNACIVACQAENNIPVVGPEEIARGRLMHWLRIDRYFIRLERETRIQPFPMACQQCAYAPCESVCPVNATVHTAEGLNAMTYARCWGTRYCAANCPYKARRFNFFDYMRQSRNAIAQQHNPNVTVRPRGVMEKCTYCVHRIEEAKIRRKTRLMQAQSPTASTTINLTDADLRLAEGEVRTACQAACPMEAISFGNLLDPQSRVSRLQHTQRRFIALPEQGTSPRTSYLVRIDNPNSELR